MRVLYLSPWFPYPLDTGSRTRVYHMLRALSRRHRITLLTLDPQGWAPAEMEAVRPLCEQVRLIPRDPFRRSWLRMATRFLFLRPAVAAPFAEMMDTVRKLHKKEPFDAAIAVSTLMADYALALPGVPLVLEEHNSTTRWMYDRFAAQSSLLNRLRCWVSWRKSALYESRLFRRFDAVTMASELDVAASRDLVPDRDPPVWLVPNGVDCEQFSFERSASKPNRLIFSGALGYDANYEAMHYFLQDVYPQIRQRCPDTYLRITGSTRGVDPSRLPLDESVTLTGFVDDIRSEITAARVAIVPILSGGGTRIKILEAMALGTPVVSTSKGAEGLDVTPDEDILIADSAEAFASATTRLLYDPTLRYRLAANARRLVEHKYDWQQIGEKLCDLLEDVAERPRQRQGFAQGRDL